MENRIEKFWHRVYFNLEKGYIRACIDRAYRDFCRTLEVKQYGIGEWVKIREELTLIMESNIKIMLDKPMNQEDFDQWHQHTMLRLISKDNINTMVSPNKYLTIGQAQKWVNMSLKYIYAVGDKYIPNASLNHIFYHIPIDSIIQEKLEHFGVSSLEMPWSKLDEIFRYELFQKECRSIFQNKILIDVEMELFNETTQSHLHELDEV